jgi:hypothetical protein
MSIKFTSGTWIMLLLIGGLALAGIGYARSESFAVAQIKPLSESIRVANLWIWGCAVPGLVLAVTGLVLLAMGWMGRNKQ